MHRLVCDEIYIDELDSFDEFVKAVKHQYWSELPFFRLAFFEVAGDLQTILLVDVFQDGQIVQHHLHLDYHLLDLTLEHFGRIKIASALRQHVQLQLKTTLYGAI